MRGEEIARLKDKVAENRVIIDEIKEKHVYLEPGGSRTEAYDD